MINNSTNEIYVAENRGYQESVAETLSLELQRDSRRYSAEFENQEG